MVSDLQTLSSTARSSAVPTQTLTPAAPAVASPKVMAPKSVDIQFDAGQHKQDMHEAISKLNEQMSADKQGLGFSFDKVAQRTVVTVRNTTSGEVVRQIPTEDFLKLSHKIEEFKGILYNKTV